MNLSIHRRRVIFLPLLLMALVVLVLWPALSGGFIFDDYPIFIDNGAFQVDHWNLETFRGVWTWSQANVHRPLAMVSYALNYATGGSVFGFKATNLVIHLLNMMLLATFARRLLGTAWKASSEDTQAHRGRTAVWAFVLATAWALHPLQVSTVMYVVQRMELLGLTFTLLALLAYWRARQLQMLGRRAWPWLLATLPLVGVGYLAKETAVLVPGYAMLLELTVLRFGAANASTRRNWKYFYATGCLVAVAIVLFYVIPHYMMNPNAFANRSYTAGERELTQLRALPMYIGWSIAPIPTHMHFYYDNYVVSTGWLHPLSTLFGGLFLLSLSVLAVALRHRRPLFSLGIGWFFMAHLITSAPLSLELVFEHRNYPALFGILLAVADLIWLATRHAHPRLPAILGTILITGLGFFTVLRAATWGNPLQLAMTLVHDNPSSPRASYDLARTYMDLSYGDRQSPFFARAVKELERGAALPNASPLPEQALLITAASTGAPAQDAWWNSLIHKLRTHALGPQEFRALQGLGARAISGEASFDVTRLAEAYETVLQRRPRHASLHVQYADVASMVMHDNSLAIIHLKRALDAKQSDPDYPVRLVGYLIANNRLVEAMGVSAYAEKQHPGLTERADWQALSEPLKVMNREKHQ